MTGKLLNFHTVHYYQGLIVHSVENAENFLILRFYVKSILANSRGPKMANLTVSEALYFDFA